MDKQAGLDAPVAIQANPDSRFHLAAESLGFRQGDSSE